MTAVHPRGIPSPPPPSLTTTLTSLPSQQASLDKLNPSLSYFRKSTFDQHSADTLAEVAGSWVDVRDVALAHVLALEKEEAGGERFLTSAGPWSRQEICEFCSRC